MRKKTYHAHHAIKTKREAIRVTPHGKMTQIQLAAAMNPVFADQGIPDGIMQKQIADIENGHSNLGLVRGLAVAQVLDTTFSSLLQDWVLQIGPLESRLLTFDSAAAVSQFFLTTEREGRVVVYSRFPGTIYLATSAYYQRYLTPQVWQLEQARRWQLAKVHIQTQKFYSIECVFEFAFSILSPFTTSDKLLILRTVLHMFINSNNRLHFFPTNHRFHTTANYLFSRANRSICLADSCQNTSFLEISNPVLYEQLLATLCSNAQDQQMVCFTNNLESIELLQHLVTVLETTADAAISIRSIYAASSPRLQQLLHATVQPVLIEAAG